MLKNHLAKEPSRYLQQHADNPVDWYSWCSEALEKAKQENKPILLSIGYSACHWCHVMAEESFEDEETAALMNRLFINIKVDREERPDLDKIYQMAHRLIAGKNGGWPLTLFLTPNDLTPFFAGTYFPKRAGLGTPSFKEILQRIAEYYQKNFADIVNQNDRLQAAFKQISEFKPDENIILDKQPLTQAGKEAGAEFDFMHGGFGSAPKFPHPTLLEFLLRNWAISKQQKKEDKTTLMMVRKTLEQMAKGGVYDQLSGGFFRYTVDAAWQIPHFEKMLYDNAQLLGIYAQATAIENNVLFKHIAGETAMWLLHEMRAADGGFYATLDADSEHEEGKFYCWDAKKVKALLSEQEYKMIVLYFGLDQPANFESHWHLTVHADPETIAQQLQMDLQVVLELIESARQKLFKARVQRVRPGRDEKIITAWNALMIKGLALAGFYLHDNNLVIAAQKCLNFIIENLWKDNRLYAHYQNEKADTPAYLDDYAFLLDAVMTLLSVQWRTADLYFAIQLADQLLHYFYDKQNDGFFFTAKDQEKTLYNPKPLMDEAVPAGSGVAAFALQRLGHLIGEMHYLTASEKTLKFAWSSLQNYSSVHCTLLNALDEFLVPPQVIVLRGDESELIKWQDFLKKEYAPNRLVFAIPASEKNLPGILKQQKPLKNKVVAYVCKGHECLEPMSDLKEFERIIF